MIKHIIIILLFCANSLKAKELDVFNSPVKGDIKEIEKYVPKPKTLRGNFKQIKTITDIKKNFVSTGNFIFSDNSGLFWSINQPFSRNLLFNENKLFKIIDGKKEIISEQNQEIFKEISKIFQSLFSGKYEDVKQYFEIFFIGDKKNWVIGLKPNNEIISQTIKYIKIKGRKNMKEIEIKEEFDDKTVIIFTNVKSKNKLDKSEEIYFK